MKQNKELECKSLEDYLALKYPISIFPENEGYTVIISDFSGCINQGKTLEEAIYIN